MLTGTVIRKLLQPTLIAAALALTTAQLSAAEPGHAVPVDKVENKVAPESEKSVTPPDPAAALVRKVSPGVFQIGKITIKQATREIIFPAQTNITNPGSQLEYLLVHFNGEKIHESLLVTRAEPEHFNIALKLLRYKESKELFRLLKPDGTPGEKYPDTPEETRKAARFGIYLTIGEGEKKKTFPATDWVMHRVTKKPMPNTPWVYNGSYVHKKKFKAGITGSIASIFPDFAAIANYPGDDRDDDTLWFPAPRVSPEGTKVTVTLKPWKG